MARGRTMLGPSKPLAEMGCRVRRSRVVLTPRSRRQVCGGVRAQPGFAAPYSQATVTNKPDHRGEHEGNRKTIARGMPGLLRCTCGDYTRVLTSHFAREASGALGTRHSLRPLFLGERFLQKLGRLAPRDRGVVSDECERARLSAVIARLDRATQYSRDAYDGIEKPRGTGYPAGACHRARRRRDPVAGYDDRFVEQPRRDNADTHPLGCLKN